MEIVLFIFTVLLSKARKLDLETPILRILSDRGIEGFKRIKLSFVTKASCSPLS